MDATDNFKDCFQLWRGMPTATIRQFVKLSYGLDPLRDSLHEVGGERTWPLIYAVRYGHLRSLGQERSNDPDLPSDGPLHEVDHVLDTYEVTVFAVGKGWDIPEELRNAFLRTAPHVSNPPDTTDETDNGLPAWKPINGKGTVTDTEQSHKNIDSPKQQPRKRKRLDNLGRAVLDALEHLPSTPTIQQVFDYLASKDNTGFIRGRDGDELTWENGRGDQSRTSKKALANRLTRLIREHEAGR